MAISSTYTFAGATSPIVGTNYNHFKSVTTAFTINATGVVLNSNAGIATATSGNSFYSGYESGWTFEIKFKATAIAFGQRLFTVENSTSNNGFVTIDGGNVVAHYIAGGGTSQASVPAGFFITDNTFYTYKFVYDGSQISFFRNGTQIGTSRSINPPRTDYQVNRVWILGSPAGLSGATATDPITVEYATFSLGSQNFQKITRTVAYVGFTNQTDATFANACGAIPADLIAANQQWDILIGPSSATNNEWVLSNIANAITFNQVVNGDVTRFVRVSAVPGLSFRDHPNKSNNALRYNTANGIAIKNTAGYCVWLRPYCIVENLQLSGGAFFYGAVETSTFGGIYGPGDAIIRNCILESYNGYYMFKHAAGYAASTLVNCLLYMITPQEGGGIGGDVLAGGDWNSNYYNCTFIIQNPRRAMFGVGANYGTNAMKNCVFINVLPVSGFQLSFSGNASNNFSTDNFSGYGVTATKISGEKQFQNLYGNGLLDARVRQGSDLIGAGIRLQSFTNDEDILGNPRSTTSPTAGCHEFSTTYYTRKATNLIVGKLGTFLNRRWQEQPQLALPLDYKNRLTADIVHAGVPAHGVFNAANYPIKFDYNYQSLLQPVPGRGGMAWRTLRYNEWLSSVWPYSSVQSGINFPQTLVSVMSSEYADITGVPKYGGPAWSTGSGARFWVNSNGYLAYVENYTELLTSTTKIPTKTVNVLASTSAPGIGTRLYVNGNLVASDAVYRSGAMGTYARPARLGYTEDAGTYRWLTYFSAAWKRALTANEIAELSANVWNIFQPQKSKLYSFGYSYSENTRPRTNIITTQTNAVAASNIDCGLGTYFTKTVSANTTFTVSNVPSDRLYKFVLRLTVTSGTITWWSGVNWPETNAPYLTPNRSHLLIFQTTNGGTTWQGSYSLDYIDNSDSDPILSSGLLLYLDVGKTNSYPGTGTTWTDISGNNINATLVNGPTYSSANGGQIVFNGTNNYAVTSSSIGVVSEATFLIWLKRNGSQVSWPGLIYERTGSINGLSLRDSTLQIGYTWNVTFFDWASGLIVPDGQWCMVVVSISSTSGTAYLCQSSGITSATNVGNHPSTTFGTFNIGQDPLGSRFFKGSISSTMIYNRALTAAEVQQNFNATRARFGI